MVDAIPEFGRHRRSRKMRAPGAILASVTAVTLVVGLVIFMTRQSVRPEQAGAAPSSIAAITSSPTPLGTPSAGSADGSGPAVTATTTRSAQPIGGQLSRRRCPLPDGSLTIAAAPDIAPALRSIAAGVAAPACSVIIVDQDPASFVLHRPPGTAGRPDVWIPNSSIWSARAASDGLPIMGRPSVIATSPIVLAVTATAAARVRAATGDLSIAKLMATPPPSPLRIGIPDPSVSVASAGALLDVKAAIPATASNAALAFAVRSTPAGLPTSGPALLDRMATGTDLAVPVSEHDLWQYNGSGPAVQGVAIYPSSAVPQLDYPYVIIGNDAQVTSVANQFLDVLTTAAARQVLMDSGFRDPSGAAGVAGGVDPTVRERLTTPSLAAVDDTVREVAVVAKPAKVLAVIDVSGSMAQQVPGGAGQTRLQYAQAAAIRGLALYPPDSLIGLWTFSRNLTATTDYRQIIPISPLVGPKGDDGGEQRLSTALASLQVNPDGGTGLYDTTLAAVRKIRQQWDPHRFNTVLILSDGQNVDRGSIDLRALVATLKHEQVPGRPVPVIAIAFGPDSDVAAMTQISDATGGATYIAKVPQDIGRIFLDAVGHRLCTPQC